MVGETGRTVSRLTMALGLVAMIAATGCDGGRTGNGRNAFTTQPNRIQGTAQAGPLRNAAVNAFRIENGQKGSSLGVATTNSDGAFTIAFTSGNESYTGAVLLEASGGTFRDEGTGNDVQQSPNDLLRAVIPALPSDGSLFYQNVTPLTTLATALAEQASGGLTVANLTAAGSALNAIYGGAFDINSTRLVNPGVAQSGGSVAVDIADHTAAVAALSLAAAQQGLNPNAYLANLIADIADGKLDGRNRSGASTSNDGAIALQLARGLQAFVSSANNTAQLTVSTALLNAVAAFDGNVARNLVPGVDALAPRVLERFPAGSALDVALNSRIYVKFNEELNANTVNGTTFVVRNGTVAVPGTVSYDARSRVATFTATGNLPASASLSVSITTGVRDLAGNALSGADNFQFTTGAAANPNNGFAGTVTFSPGAVSTVSTNTSFLVSFDRALDPTALFTVGVVSLLANGGAVPFNISYNLGAQNFSVTPVFALPNGASVTVMVAGSAQSATGGQLGNDTSVTVTTDAAGTQDQTRPVVVAVDPASGATTVQRTDSITIKFSEAMNSSSVLAAVSLAQGTTPVSVSATYNSLSNSVSLRPASALIPGASYTVTVGTGARDLAGNTLAAAFTSGFTVAQPALAITTASLPNALVNQLYSQAIQVLGGTGPFSFSLAAGSSLPAGLMLDAQNPGVITGTPTTAGSTSFTIVVTDSSASVQSASQSLSITVDAQPVRPTVAFVSAQSATMNEATQSFAVSLRLSTPSPLSQAVSVDVVDTRAGTARSGTDYQNFGTMAVNFPVGSQDGQVVSVTVGVVNDNLFEGNETITLALQNITGGPNAVIGGAASHVVTITDDGPFPTVALDAANVLSINEGQAGSVGVRLSNPTINTVTVPFTVSGTALNPADHDLAASGQIVVPAGMVTASVSFQTVLDMVDEEDMESIVVTLGNPVNGNATLVNPSTQTFNILDQNVLPTISIADLGPVSEGVGSAAFTLTLTPPHGRQIGTVVSVDVVVAAQSATAGADLTVGTQTVTFQPGQMTATVSVPVVDDSIDEDSETFTATLANPVLVQISVLDNVGDASITDNDNPPAVSFSTSTQVVGEGVGQVTLTINLDNPNGSGKTISVPFAVDGASSANNPMDHNLVDGAFPDIQGTTMPPGQNSSSITFNVVDDAVTELDETIIVNLGNPTNATLGTVQTTTVTIQDNEGTPSVTLAILDSQGNPIAPNGMGRIAVPERGNYSVRATMNRSSSQDVSFNLTTTPGTAAQPIDNSDFGVGPGLPRSRLRRPKRNE
jgi:hypothetical protein